MSSLALDPATGLIVGVAGEVGGVTGCVKDLSSIAVCTPDPTLGLPEDQCSNVGLRR